MVVGARPHLALSPSPPRIRASDNSQRRSRQRRVSKPYLDINLLTFQFPEAQQTTPRVQTQTQTTVLHYTPSSSSQMALSIGGHTVCTGNPQTHHLLQRQPLHPSSSISLKRTSHITGAKKFTSRTGKFDSRNRRSGGGGLTTTIKEEEKEEEQEEEEWGDEADTKWVINGKVVDDFVLPDLQGEKIDFWEGPQYDGLGLFLQYQWAFGILFALIACGVAVATYNEGATDFKQTPVYKESIQSRDLLEEPEASNSDVFEGNPTETAPSLE